MGEIKSALELAMERSKTYVISKEDRQAIRQKEILQKATGLFHRYQESHVPFHEIEREIERLDEGVRDSVKEALRLQWIEALSLSGDHEKMLDGIELIRGRDLKEVRERLRALLKEYGEEAEKARRKKSQLLKEALKQEGIYGEAVEPNLEGDDEWKTLVNSLRQSYHERLEEIKNVIKAS